LTKRKTPAKADPLARWRPAAPGACDALDDATLAVALDHYAATSQLTAAAKVAGIPWPTFRQWTETDPDAPAMLAAAEAEYRDHLIEVAQAAIQAGSAAILRLELMRVEPDYRPAAQRQRVEAPPEGERGVIVVPEQSADADAWEASYGAAAGRVPQPPEPAPAAASRPTGPVRLSATMPEDYRPPRLRTVR